MKIHSVFATLMGLAIPSAALLGDPLPPDATYRPLPTVPFNTAKANDEAAKPEVLQRQRSLLERRYELADRPRENVMMSGGRKPVQDGVRVKLRAGTTWDSLGGM